MICHRLIIKLGLKVFCSKWFVLNGNSAITQIIVYNILTIWIVILNSEHKKHENRFTCCAVAVLCKKSIFLWPTVYHQNYQRA